MIYKRARSYYCGVTFFPRGRGIFWDVLFFLLFSFSFWVFIGAIEGRWWRIGMKEDNESGKIGDEESKGEGMDGWMMVDS